MVSQNQALGLRAELNKPWPKWILMQPEKQHIWWYLGGGIAITIATVTTMTCIARNITVIPSDSSCPFILFFTL